VPLLIASICGTACSYDEIALLHHMSLLPFSVESTGGLSREAEHLVDQIGLACRDHLTLETHESIARGVRASVKWLCRRGTRWLSWQAIAGQSCRWAPECGDRALSGRR
jgi:hypothetical protein